MKVKVKSELVKQYRKQAHLTQEQLAELTDLHPRTVQRMETDGMVSSKTLDAVAKAFNVEPYTLEFMTDEIDFGPLLIELKVVLLAVTRKLLPKDIRNLPNSLVAVLTLLSFSASFTLINTVITIMNQPQHNYDSVATSGLFSLVLIFCGVYATVVYPLFKLKKWARVTMLGICCVFAAINTGLIVTELLSSDDFAYANLLEYCFNLVVVFWIARILMRADIRRLFESARHH